MKKENLIFGVYTGIFLIFIGLCVGWIYNLILILSEISGPITAMFITRLVGVFVLPLGGILGYF